MTLALNLLLSFWWRTIRNALTDSTTQATNADISPDWCKEMNLTRLRIFLKLLFLYDTISQKMIKKSLFTIMLTGSKSLFKTLVISSSTAGRRLAIYNRSAREASEWKELLRVGRIRRKQNIADRLTKLSKCEAQGKLIKNGKLENLPFERWIERVNTIKHDGGPCSCDTASQKENNSSVHDNKGIMMNKTINRTTTQHWRIQTNTDLNVLLKGQWIRPIATDFLTWISA